MTDTPHEQLAEPEQLMRKLGWWEECLTAMPECSRNALACTYWYTHHTTNGRISIPDNISLAIIVTRAEKELLRKGWMRGPYPTAMNSRHTNGENILLVDALRTEIEIDKERLG